MTFKHLLPLFLLSAACVTPIESDGEENDTGETSSAVSVGRFRGGATRKFGGACKFNDDASGPADSFVIANGQDVSIVFTRLGEGTRRNAHSGIIASRCNFAVPIDVPEGSFLSGWTQSLQYGIVKPSGVRAGLGLDSALQRAGEPLPTGGATLGRGVGRALALGPTRTLGRGMFQLPSISVNFDREPALNVPLAVATAPTDGFDETDPRYALWRNKWCATGRTPALDFVGSAYTWAERARAGTESVIIAIDGLDARFDLGTVTETCPAPPTRPGGGARPGGARPGGGGRPGRR